MALNLLCSYLILELNRYGSPQDMSRLSSTEYEEAAGGVVGSW